MMKYTAVLEKPVGLSTRKSPEPLLRQALGAALRAFRADRGITLRELAEASRVSPGYLSELERGRKEVSSELLASVCQALGIPVSDVLIEAAGTMAINHADVSFARV
ncbi:helix-turn-helix domain-containing protein [Corynebacterium sp. HS2168-gen11]|uniref:helix-turn-helix domain-containing protein n=1 Tax=Corynebacterium sp. HS2168-gen11 TaxID=2974027 RepID=UPI00216ACFEB|nr:helix-turn-helix transcriptional regulator [Corynebacterium sp. HS2168-gen11]MCS4536341.1 helix-turn-helix domain-containing protein [Corynebacterium sp. HS2168-gen11]